MRHFFAKSMTAFFRFFADTFFAKRYGHRAVVLETVAGVPGMVAGMLVHLKSLRNLQKGNGTMIHELLAEAENERKHLMFFIELIRPNIVERTLIVIAQFLFWHYYLLMYFLSPKTAHLMTHYFEIEAVKSYTNYLQLIKEGKIANPPAPLSAIKYYKLPENARLSDMIVKIRDDEQKHSEVNLKYSEQI